MIGFVLSAALIAVGAKDPVLAVRPPAPVILTLLARDRQTGQTLYTRTVYVVFGPINEPGVAERDAVVESIGIERQMAMPGQNCDLSSVVEVANWRVDDCP